MYQVSLILASIPVSYVHTFAGASEENQLERLSKVVPAKGNAHVTLEHLCRASSHENSVSCKADWAKVSPTNLLAIANARSVASKLPADEVDLWSCSKRFRQEIVDWFSLLGSQMHVVEIGTYRGLTTAVLSHVFRSVVTIDINASLLNQAKRRNSNRDNIVYVLADSGSNWWESSGDAEVLVIDGCHSYECVRRDLESGISHLPSLAWVILDDYGALGDVARAVEESRSSGFLSLCEPLGRRSGERLPCGPTLGLNGPEAVLCAVSKTQHPQSKSMAKVFFGGQEDLFDDNAPAFFVLHGKHFQVCIDPCILSEDMQKQQHGYINFTEIGSTPDSLVSGIMHFSIFRGGGRGRWQQARRGISMAWAFYKGKKYYFSFLPNMMGFQANIVDANGIGGVLFKGFVQTIADHGWWSSARAAG